MSGGIEGLSEPEVINGRGDGGIVVGTGDGDVDGLGRIGGVVGLIGVIGSDDVKGEGDGFALAQEVEVLRSGVLPTVLSTASDGEGVGGESRELFLAQLGIDVSIGPADVAVVGGREDDGVIESRSVQVMSPVASS